MSGLQHNELNHVQWALRSTIDVNNSGACDSNARPDDSKASVLATTSQCAHKSHVIWTRLYNPCLKYKLGPTLTLTFAPVPFRLQRSLKLVSSASLLAIPDRVGDTAVAPLSASDGGRGRVNVMGRWNLRLRGSRVTTDPTDARSPNTLATNRSGID